MCIRRQTYYMYKYQAERTGSSRSNNNNNNNRSRHSTNVRNGTAHLLKYRMKYMISSCLCSSVWPYSDFSMKKRKKNTSYFVGVITEKKKKKKTVYEMITSTNDWWFHQWLSGYLEYCRFRWVACAFSFYSYAILFAETSISHCHSVLRSNWITHTCTSHTRHSIEWTDTNRTRAWEREWASKRNEMKKNNHTPFPIRLKWHFRLMNEGKGQRFRI